MASTSRAPAGGNGWRGNGARQQRHHLYDDVLALAGTLMRGRQEAGAEKIGHFADAARGFGERLPGMPNVRVYTTAAADKLAELSRYVAETDLERMVDDTTAFARRHPAATIGAGILAGWCATRLMHGSPGLASYMASPAQTRRAGTKPPRKRAASRKRSGRQAA